MSEAKNGDTANGDMAPQEDSSKLPLTEDTKVEMKTAEEPTNGEAGVEDDLEFRGLTKDELLQYAKEPFWVRLRIFLMVLFWASWVVMLVLAILIIVKAPRCEPPPSITWLQQSPLLEVDVNAVKPDDAISLLSSLGLTSLYIPGLISDRDFNLLNHTKVAETINALITAVSGDNADVVTDFVPSPVQQYHNWLSITNSNITDAIDPYSRNLNYDAPVLEEELVKVFRKWKDDFNVTGFLVDGDELEQYPDLRNLTANLNQLLNDDNIVIGERSVDINDVLLNLNIPGSFKEFVMQNVSDWTYFKYNPITADHSTASPKKMPAVTLSMMLLSGTPVLQVTERNLTAVEDKIGPLVRECAKLRKTDAIKFGETQFVNTAADVLAFSRNLKGTPGYAVAVNFGMTEQAVNFTSLNYLPYEGNVVYSLTENADNMKVSLDNFKVMPHSGYVIQFVAKY